MLKGLLMRALSSAAQNPTVRREAAKVAATALDKSKPTLLAGSRKLGEMTRAAGQEIKQGVENFEKGRKGKS